MNSFCILKNVQTSFIRQIKITRQLKLIINSNKKTKQGIFFFIKLSRTTKFKEHKYRRRIARQLYF